MSWFIALICILYLYQFLIKYLGGYKPTLLYLSLSAQCSSDFREMLQGALMYPRLGLLAARESGLQFACPYEYLLLAMGISFEKWKLCADHLPHLALAACLPAPACVSVRCCSVQQRIIVMGEVFCVGSKSKEKWNLPGHSYWSQRWDSHTETIMI